MHNATGTNDASYQENNRLTYNPITQLNQIPCTNCLQQAT
jgi:hypothetical protein